MPSHPLCPFCAPRQLSQLAGRPRAPFFPSARERGHPSRDGPVSIRAAAIATATAAAAAAAAAAKTKRNYFA